MMGSHERTCIHSEWTNTKPVCSGLNQENDYASGFSLKVDPFSFYLTFK